MIKARVRRAIETTTQIEQIIYYFKIFKILFKKCENVDFVNNKIWINFDIEIERKVENSASQIKCVLNVGDGSDDFVSLDAAVRGNVA